MKVAQSCLTLRNPMDYTVYGILQARILEWVTFSFSSGSLCVKSHKCIFYRGIFFGCIIYIRSDHITRSVVSDSLWPHGLDSPRNSPGQNTGVGSHSLFQGIFPIQGSNPGLYCRWILYQLSHQGSPGRFLFSFSCCLVTKSFPTFLPPYGISA